MESDYEKGYFRDMVRKVQRKLALIPESSHIHAAAIDMVGTTIEQIENNCVNELKWAYWNPLFLFLYSHSIAEIKNLERDIDLISRHSNRVKISEITQFLKANPQSDRLWSAGLFETFVKAQCIKKHKSAVVLDCLLPNGRDTDIQFQMEDKAFHLECTVITESDEDKEVWDRFMAVKKVDAKASLVRPGRFGAHNSKSPSPYYDCLRLYAKVYDKIAKQLNPRKAQMADDSPNVLLVSFYSPRASLSVTSPGVGWALDELLADQPKSGTRVKDQLPGSIDISLLAWLEFTAQDLCPLDRRTYCDDFHEIVAAPRKMGAILLFDGCSLKRARVNYNALESCKVSHSEIARLEKLLKQTPSYCKQ